MSQTETALRNARQFAAGGSPFGERMAARSLQREGFLHSNVPGRTDKLPITVGGGAYVVPADHLAAIGQGNSLSGANILNRMFKSGPAGSGAMPLRSAKASTARLNLHPKVPKARGGETGHGKDTPIIAADGEYVISPAQIIERFGSLDKGHKALDHWILSTRKKHIKTLRNLRPPKKD